MSTKKINVMTPDDAEAVFYEAFGHCDSAVMTAVWADGDVVCVHPGSGVIIGHANVTRSWGHIFTNAQRPAITFSVVKRIESADLAVHVVIEDIASGPGASARILATNVFRRYAQGWLLVEHHASVVAERPPALSLQ